jgi:transposase
VIAKHVAVKKYIVKLSDEERVRLNTLIHKGKHGARQLTKARILLKADASEADEGWSDSQIATALDISIGTVARARKQLVEESFEAVLTRKHSPASARKRIFDGAAEVKLVAVACSKPPTGRARWTLKLLEEAVVELNIVARASDNTIGRMRKNALKPHLKMQWVVPPDANAVFVAGMEDVLEVYQRPHDPACLAVCVGETSKQLIAETRVPIAAKPGHPARHDFEYQRNGTANLFLIFAPLESWRHVKVTECHTAVDYAQVLKELSDTHFGSEPK